MRKVSQLSTRREGSVVLWALIAAASALLLMGSLLLTFVQNGDELVEESRIDVSGGSPSLETGQA